VEATGVENLLYCAANGARFVSRMPSARTAQRGESLALRFDMEQAHFFDPATSQALT
jgi:multiple sugar transport system ATP-binding protein